MSPNEPRALAHYPTLRTENVRYRDTDRQGHVNNAVFSTYLECARTSILYDRELNLISPGCEFVIVQLEIEFLKEMSWPGHVEIGTRVARIGRSSVVMEQAIFQDGDCTATSHSTMVMIDAKTRKSAAFAQPAIGSFGKMTRGSAA